MESLASYFFSHGAPSLQHLVWRSPLHLVEWDLPLGLVKRVKQQQRSWKNNLKNLPKPWFCNCCQVHKVCTVSLSGSWSGCKLSQICHLKQGSAYFFTALPVAIVGYFSAKQPRKCCDSRGCKILAKTSWSMMKGVILAAMVETYAILAFVVSFLLTLRVG